MAFRVPSSNNIPISRLADWNVVSCGGHSMFLFCFTMLQTTAYYRFNLIFSASFCDLLRQVCLPARRRQSYGGVRPKHLPVRPPAEARAGTRTQTGWRRRACFCEYFRKF